MRTKALPMTPELAPLTLEEILAYVRESGELAGYSKRLLEELRESADKLQQLAKRYADES